MAQPRTRNIITAILLIIALIELIRTAWISDDAAITLRPFSLIFCMAMAQFLILMNVCRRIHIRYGFC